MRNALTRGVSLFLAAFTVLNLLGDLRFARANANLWWIDFWPVPLADRVATACDLYRAGLARRLLFSGGPSMPYNIAREDVAFWAYDLRRFTLKA